MGKVRPSPARSKASKAWPQEERAEVHLALDTYATHKTPAVKRWFLRHPESRLHVTPTSSSWLNQVERFFGKISGRRIRRVAGPEAAIKGCQEHHITSAKALAWTIGADLRLGRIGRVCEPTSDSGDWRRFVCHH